MCGVFGVFGHPEASHLTYLGLHGLQHRGQESAGICSSDGQQMFAHRRMGRVADAFDSTALASLLGDRAIGHVRYSTAGPSVLKNAGPIAVELAGTSLALAHNGNLTNYLALRRELEAEGALFRSSMDTEVIVHLLARAKGKTLVERLQRTLPRLEGAYTLLLLTPDQIIGVRDPFGFRPLVLGQLRQGRVLSSETCALRLVEATFVREVAPGEILVIDAGGLSTERVSTPEPVSPRQCIFEHVYFARPDSVLFGQSVYAVRRALGRRLAQECPAPTGEVVIPVPDSGTTAAVGYAAESGLPFELGLVRSHYSGRTFIEPASSIRHFGVKLKLSPVEEVIRGRSVVVVDDSLVRGTTSQKIVRMLREAGAREVHVRISAPPTTHSCFFGIDTPTKGELIAANHTVEEITRYLGADSLAYLSLDGLHACADGGRARFCDACFSGRYPVRVEDQCGPGAKLLERE
jgi:amidophosphoribosyltransferase